MCCGVKYDWNGLCAWVGLELLADAEAGCVGQIDVQQDGVRMMRER